MVIKMVPQICLQKSSYAEQVKTGTRLQSLMCQGQILETAWDNSIDSFKVVQDYYDKIIDYMQFEDMGRVIGMGCGTPSMTQGTRYPQEAYELGKKI